MYLKATRDVLCLPNLLTTQEEMLVIPIEYLLSH